MSLTLGEITIGRVVEMEGPFTEPHMLLPDATPEGWPPIITGWPRSLWQRMAS